MIKKGALAGLQRGPRVGGEVIDVQVILHNFISGRGTADSFIMAAAVQCVQKVKCLHFQFDQILLAKNLLCILDS